MIWRVLAAIVRSLRPTIRTVERLRLRSGDIVVLESPDRLDTKLHERIQTQMKLYLPPGVEVIILDRDLTLAAVLGASE